MPDGEQHKKVKRNRKSVQLQLSSSIHSVLQSAESEFEPVPLTARSTALPFQTTTITSNTQSGATAPNDQRSRSNKFFASPHQMAMAAMSIISPRSGNYDRLEGGMGPSRTGPSQAQGWRRFGWKKFALAAAALICVVWLWGPRERRFDWSGIKKGLGTKKPSAEILVPPIHHEEDYASSSSPKAPLTFETDPDPRKTLSCTTPFHSSSQIVQYALMIDAGSTGSRIHVYKFNNCGASPSYEYEVFKMTQPGLSSFAGRPLEAAKSLDVLLDEAVRVIPSELQSCTPVAVKATAGLRLLGGRQSTDILEKVEERIREQYKFQLPEKDGVVIMDGKDEGVYAWITANYLLGTISTTTASQTYAVLDLGGASTQIVFEPTFHSETKLVAGEHKYDLDFGGHTYELYQHSYLGYGLMRARSHVHRLVEFMASIRPGSTSPFHSIDSDGDGTPDLDVIPNPCLAQGTHRVVEITDDGKAKKVTMSGADVGSFKACDRVVQLVLAKDTVCEVKPCSFNGVYQPSLLDSFKNGKVLLLSYFYDRLAPLLDAQEALSVATFAKVASTVCAGPKVWKGVPGWSANRALMEELEGRPEWCLDLTFMHALLKMGYEFEEERRIDIGKKIKGTELGWCLGATIAMVSGGELKCRA